MFGALSFAVVGIILAFLSLVFFVAADKSQPVENSQLPPLLDWSLLLAVIAVFCLLSEFLNFTAVFLIMTVLTGVAYGIHWAYRRRHEVIEDLSFWHVIDYLKAFFWIFTVIFIIRAFIVDLSVIPSSSMRPGLVVGDFVLVNKFSYGIKEPLTNKTLIAGKEVKRGDVVVFNFPLNEKIQYVKRVIGVPGDEVAFVDKELIINGKKISKIPVGTVIYTENSYNVSIPYQKKVMKFRQNLGNKDFYIYEIPEQEQFVGKILKQEKSCEIRDNRSLLCTIPPGHYLVLGDNRDNSEDGRYWGYVKSRQILGKAFFVWMNFKDWQRIGTHVQ